MGVKLIDAMYYGKVQISVLLLQYGIQLPLLGLSKFSPVLQQILCNDFSMLSVLTLHNIFLGALCLYVDNAFQIC
jgi:hypothetical protein